MEILSQNVIPMYFILLFIKRYLTNEFNFWNAHGIMNTSGLLQSKWSPLRASRYM